MDYMTLKEASEKWGVSIRQINYYCAGGRIPGAVKVATIWLIPKDAEKPVDMRTKQGKEQKDVWIPFIGQTYDIGWFYYVLVLYVEDDLSLIDGLQYTLEASGYMVDNAKTVKEALALFRKNTYDLLLLDVTLPDGTGFDVCKAVRNSSTVPIIFLTASDQEISIVRGLDMGADDYITKPFKLNELLSRIKAILRRSLQFSKADTFLEANGIRVDTAERLVWKNDEPLDLPLVEYKLLCLFMQNPNHLMPREMILDRMWDGNGNFVDDNTLSVYIRRLRNKIEDTPNQPKYLLTERGIGYKWVVE